MGLDKWIVVQEPDGTTPSDSKMLHWHMWDFIPLKYLFEDDIQYETYKRIHAETVVINLMRFRHIRAKVVKIWVCELGEEGVGKRRWLNYIIT